MKSLGAAVAALGVALGSVAANANVHPSLRTFRAPQAPAATVRTMRRAPNARRRGTAMGCATNEGTTNGNQFYVGVSDAAEGNIAGGSDGAVLGGSSNESCQEESAIAAGYQNTIDANSGYGSFIGAGENNVASGTEQFLGAGVDNQVDGASAFIGAGAYGEAEGAGSFVGAGGLDYDVTATAPAAGSGNVAGGIDSFVGAGDVNQISSKGNGSFLGAGGYTDASNSTANNQVTGSDSFLGAGDGNFVDGQQAFVGAGSFNDANGPNSFVGGGNYNATSTGGQGFVGAGELNYAQGIASFVGAGNGEYFLNYGASSFASDAAGEDSFIGAGDLNSINANGAGSFIGAGGYSFAYADETSPSNSIGATDSFIGAGDQNSVNGTEGFIGSGGSNTIGSAASYASIIGGNRNTASGKYASIIGGFGNVASGAYGIVAGGDSNTAAGIVSFAAGYHADAVHNGTFVWSDYSSGSKDIKDTAANQFVARASGGTYLYSNEAATSGVKLAAGSGTWASLSDRNAKAGIVPVDDAALLAKIATLPVSTWRYKTEQGVRHAGPMAQDFYSAIRVGEDDRHIATIDEDGVALAAIKALDAELERKDAAVLALAERIHKLEGTRK
jgi:trimeric autotransporter adhesin